MAKEKVSAHDNETMRKWIESGDKVVVGRHVPSQADRIVIERLATEALTKHRFRGAWSASDKLIVLQVLEVNDIPAWQEGRIALLTWGWPGDFGSCLSLTMYLRGSTAHPEISVARSVVPKGEEFLDVIESGPIRVALVNGKQIVRCDTIDFTSDATILEAFRHHVSNARDHEPDVYPDADVHFWEVVALQTNLHDYLTTNDKLTLGWFDRYKRTARGGKAALTVLSEGKFSEVCGRAELSDRVRGIVAAIANSKGDAGPVLAHFATCYGNAVGEPWEFLKELQALPDEEEGDCPFTGVQGLFQQFLESPSQTGFGHQFHWLTVDGNFSTLRIEPRQFPSHVDAREYWNRMDFGFIKLGLGYSVTGHDVFIGKEELCADAPRLPTCEDAEECLKQAEFLLAEGHANKRGTIPPRATVEMRIGPYSQVEMTELDDNVFVVLRRDDGLIDFGAVEPNKGYFSYDLPDPDTEHVYDKERITAAVKLLLAAIVRDFWIVEQRERVFSTREVASKSTSGKVDDDRARIVYLPRVKYTPTDRPDVAECAKNLDSIKRRAHFVAAHLRKSSSASAQQKLLAERYGIDLPEGYTFVKPHERGKKARDVVYRSRSALQSLYRAVDPGGEPDPVNWFRFERDVQQLMTSLGFEVEHIAASKRGDQGVDVYATKGIDLDAVHWIIQCKCWRPDRKVGPGVVRELIGTLTRFPAGTRGMIVTTSGFTSGATTEAAASNIRLMAGDEFAEKLLVAEAADER